MFFGSRKKKKLADNRRIRNLLNASTIGMSLVSSIFIGTGIGVYLDKYFSTKPWLTLFFMLCGVAAGFKNVFYFLNRSGLDDDEN